MTATCLLSIAQQLLGATALLLSPIFTAVSIELQALRGKGASVSNTA